MKDKRAERISNALDLLIDCCVELKESGRCNDTCPMYSQCLEETDALTVACSVTKWKIADFLKAADTEPEMTKEEWEAEQADLLIHDPEDF